MFNLQTNEGAKIQLFPLQTLLSEWQILFYFPYWNISYFCSLK